MRARTLFFRPLAASASSVLVITAACGQTPVPSALGIGAQSVDCLSALQVGLHGCAGDANAPNSTASAAGQRAPLPAQAAIESQIDAYLASYGKPPREAVRALLNPSDDNIRAFLAQQEKTLSIAGYVAARMTALKQESSAVSSSSGLSRDEPGLSQMRVRLHQRPQDTSTRETVQALANLARLMPGLQAGVALAGPVSAVQLNDALGRIDPVLAVLPEPLTDADAQRLPFLRIEDLQSGAVVQGDAHGLGVDQLRAAVLALRHSSAAGRATPDPVYPPGGSQ